MDKYTKFILILGRENMVLPGKTWTQYDVSIYDEKIVCTRKDELLSVYTINLKDITKASFAIGSGNLWLQLLINNEFIVFSSPRKCWKSDMGKLLINNIERFSKIENMESYKKYIGKMFFFWIFK